MKRENYSLESWFFMNLEFHYNSGGREKYFEKERVGDCVCRAIAIANDMDYLEVYNMINEYAKKEHITKRKKSKLLS